MRLVQFRKDGSLIDCEQEPFAGSQALGVSLGKDQPTVALFREVLSLISRVLVMLKPSLGQFLNGLTGVEVTWYYLTLNLEYNLSRANLTVPGLRA